MNAAGQDQRSVLWIFWWEDSYSLHFYVVPAAGDSLAETTNTKITRSAFCAVFSELWFAVIDGEEGKASLADRLLAEPCCMVFWPCNACCRLDGPNEPATQYDRAISKGRAEASKDVPGWPPAQPQVRRTQCCNTKRSHTQSLCEQGSATARASGTFLGTTTSYVCFQKSPNRWQHHRCSVSHGCVVWVQWHFAVSNRDPLKVLPPISCLALETQPVHFCGNTKIPKRVERRSKASRLLQLREVLCMAPGRHTASVLALFPTHQLKNPPSLSAKVSAAY